MSARHLPDVIRFNAIDRYFAIPETDDDNGPYFPMSAIFGVDLLEALTPERLIDALFAVNAKYPQFRLGYTLDYQHERWLRVPDAQLQAHFTAMVRISPTDGPIDRDEVVSQGLPHNPVPLSFPIQMTLYERTLYVKHQHCFGDGRFLMTVIPAILLAVFDRPAFDRLPALAMNFGMPVWKIVWQSPRQGFGTLWNWLRTLRSTIADFSTVPAADPKAPPRMAVRSGTPISSMRYVITAPVLKTLDAMRHEISTADVNVTLNTIIQVLFAHRVMELGLQSAPFTYTLPTDLRRYVRRPADFQAGNTSGQIRVKLPPRPDLDWRADCLNVQAQVDDQLQRGLALATFPMEWLMALGGRKLVRKLNRDWLLNSPHSDRRFLIVTNLGKLDAEWTAVLPYLDRTSSISLAGPLMGGPPLLIVLFGLQGECQLTLSYNPALLTRSQIDEVLAAMSPQWLAHKRATSQPEATRQV